MAVKKTTIFVQAPIYWAKVLGAPRPNYDGDAKEWTLEVEVTDELREHLKTHRLLDRIKAKNAVGGRGEYIVLKKKELTADGRPNSPIRIYDDEDQPWDETKLLGNGTVADVKITIADYGIGKQKGLYPEALRIQDLVEYKSSEFGGMQTDDKPVAKKAKAPKEDTFKKDFGLEDDLDDPLP